MAGDSPVIDRTAGRAMRPRNCLAYDEKVSKYRRCASRQIVSKASDDLPEPDTPVTTVIAPRGRSTSMPLRLCSLAPRTDRMVTLGILPFSGPESWVLSLES